MRPPAWLPRVLPIAGWLPAYRSTDLPGDLVAGVVVTIVLVPQGMAYAMLAGLPPQAGLYAAIVPLALYAALGSSRTLAVGPVAIVSLMAGDRLASLAAPGSPEYAAGALVLALIAGVVMLALAVARAGVLVNFLGHPVISGFTSAAALLIAVSQLRPLLGIEAPRESGLPAMLAALLTRLHGINAVSALIGLGAIALLLLTRGPLKRRLLALGAPPAVADPVSRTGPLLAVALGSLLVWLLDLGERAGVAVVGRIPAGLPPLSAPPLDTDLWLELAPAAVLIAVVGFLESVSVAKFLAGRRRQAVDAGQELAALGVANLGAAFTGAYPVAGGFGRSVVNDSAGASTPLASLITAALLALTVMLLTPAFQHLPRAVLAAIIIVAVATLVDVQTLKRIWRYDRGDAAALGITFLTVLGAGVEPGIIAGVAVSLGTYLWRTSRPHIAVVGRVGDSEHFRNIRRHRVRTDSRILAVRVDENLYFANTRWLEDCIMRMVAEQERVRHLVLIASAVNYIDASALETLERLVRALREAGVTVHLAEVKGPVMDRLLGSDFLDILEPGRVFLSTHEAMRALGAEERERDEEPDLAASRATQAREAG